MLSAVTRRAAALALAGALLGAGCAARLAYHQAQEEARRGNWDLAVARMTRAAQKDPDNIGYKIALENARIQASRMHLELGRKHLQAGDLVKAEEELDIASKYDVANKSAADELALVRQQIRTREAEMAERADFATKRARAAARPTLPVLSPRSLAPIALSYRDQSLQRLLETLGKLAGVNVLFDEGFRDKNVTVSLTGVTFQEALDQIAMVNRLFYKVLDQNTIIIVPESQAKRRTYDAMLLQTFYLENSEVKDVETIVKTAVGTTARIVSNPTLGAINVMGTADQIAIVSRLLELNDKARGEVVVEVKILEVDRNKLKQYGIMLANNQTQASVTYAPISDTVAATGTTVRAHLLSSLNAADFLVTLPSTIVTKFLQTEGSSKILAAPRLRAAEGKKTSLKIGTEVPVPVTTISVQNTGGVGGSFAPATSFQYRNVGVNLELTPRVTPNGDITLEMAAEFSILGDNVNLGGDSLPTFLTRNVNGQLRLRDGETALLGGLIQDSEIESFRGIIGLQSVPILNRIFSDSDKRKVTNEILFSITPHLVRAPKISEEDLRSIAIGTQEVLRVPSGGDILFGEPEPSPSPSPLAGSPAPPPGPAIGRPPGTVSPSMPDVEAATTPAATPPPGPSVVPTPLPPIEPDVAPTPAPRPLVPEPTPPPSGVPGIDSLAPGPLVGPPAPGTTVPTPAPTPAPSPFSRPASPAPLAGGSPAPGPRAGLPSPAGTIGRSSPRPPAGAMTASLSPPEARVPTGGTTAVSVVAMGVQDLTGVELVLSFDPTLVEATDALAGSLLTLDGSRVGTERSLDAGRVRAKFTRPTGTAGSGVVVSVGLRALRAGTGRLTVEQLILTSGGTARTVAVDAGAIVVAPR